MAKRNNELAVIGSVLIDSACLVEIDKYGVCLSDFDDPLCKLAFQSVERLRERNEPVDVVLVTAEMNRQEPGYYDEFVKETFVAAANVANAGLYCKALKDDVCRKRLIDTLDDALNNANYGDWRAIADTVFETVQGIKTSDSDVMTGEALADTFLDYFDLVREDPDNAYCRTGFKDVDDQLGGGMFKSEVYVIGARPGMGKTTLGINIAQNIINRGGSVLFVSLEMTAQQIQAKRISLETNIRYTEIMAGRITADEERTMRSWLNKNHSAPFYLITKPVTVGEISRHARRIENLTCVIIDYIGLVSCADESRNKPRYEQMTEISASIKAMAKMLGVPVLALSQLNRENTQRSDKRPTMADLRDSGAIEQDAGAIILLHRPDYYESKDTNEPRPEMELIELNISKNRHAEPGLVKMWWNGNYGRISMMAREHQEAHELVPIPATVMEEGELPF